MNSAIKAILVIVVVVLVLLILLSYLFFDSIIDKEVLAEIELKDKHHHVEVLFVGGGATSADYIQVIKKGNWFSHDTIIKNIKGRRTLKSYRIISQDTLELVVGSGGGYPVSGDTVFVALSDVEIH